MFTEGVFFNVGGKRRDKLHSLPIIDARASIDANYP